jgi:SAM-dependent methyltransferase/GNAT superfamily N-acetyltransferase
VTRGTASIDVAIERADLLSREARSLIEALNAELSSRYPEDGATHFRLDPNEVAPGRGAFLVARRAGRPVGCGAVRRLEAEIGEVKRMYVSPEARSGGVGRAILAALENEARALGLVRLVLETGVRQPEAVALYERAGFARIPAFGEYVNSPLSVCMAKDLAPRPFYGEFAWAYDYLVERPVAAECEGMAATLARRRMGPGATLLDAGCGNGRYAVELARRGFVVTGVDRSPALLEEAAARERATGNALSVKFERADILASAAGSGYDVVLCRGVLNDLVGAEERVAVFAAFSRALRPRGALLLDVRDWDATVARKTAEPVSEKRVDTPRGRLVFRTVSRLDPATRRLLVSERHTLTAPSGETTAAHEFVMRCWTRDELDAGLRAAGFESVEYSATYESAPPAGAGDRIVAAASLGAR